MSLIIGNWNKILLFITIILGFSFLFVPLASANSGYISIPSVYYGDGSPGSGIRWLPGEYTESPYIDGYHYFQCSTNNTEAITGVIYNQLDNSVAVSGMTSNVGCSNNTPDLIMVNGNFIPNFQDNTQYYVILTDTLTGQTWQSPCFEYIGTGSTNGTPLSACNGDNILTMQPLSYAVINQGDTYTASSSFTDPDATSWTATVDYGDGSGSQPLTLSGTNYSLSHQYNTQGTYIVTVTVTDNQGQTAGVTNRISVAGSGTISIPSVYYGDGSPGSGIRWLPGEYTESPNIDGYHYWSCSTNTTENISGVLYNESDNSVAVSGMISNVGCYNNTPDLIMVNGNFIPNFQDNTQYYVILTDTLTGQTWQSPCFEYIGTGSTNGTPLSACPTEAPPVTTASLSTQNTDGTYQNPVTVTLSATAASGYTLADTYYTVDGGSQQTYSSPFTISGSGSHTITYWSVDNGGAIESTNTKTFTIDSAPQVNTLSNKTINESGTFSESGSFTDSDSTSWTATVNYGDGSGTHPLTLSSMDFSLSHQYNDGGTYTVTVSVTSNQGLTGTASATVTVNPSVLTPSADSFIQRNGQNQNEGASPFLELSVEGKERALIQFSDSQIQAAVGNFSNYTATLRLTIVSNNNKFVTGGGQIDVDRMEQAWTEGNGSYDYNGYRGTGSGITWDCATDSDISNDSTNCSGSTAWDMIDTDSWPFDGTPTATGTISNNQSGTVSYNVTSDVESFLSGGNTNYGWLVKKDNETQDGDVQFGSKESSNSPKLIITPN